MSSPCVNNCFHHLVICVITLYHSFVSSTCVITSCHTLCYHVLSSLCFVILCSTLFHHVISSRCVIKVCHHIVLCLHFGSSLCVITMYFHFYIINLCHYCVSSLCVINGCDILVSSPWCIIFVLSTCVIKLFH